MTILEIGCGSGVAAREIVARLDKGSVHAIDRSERAIQQAIRLSSEKMASGKLSYQCVAIEDFEWAKHNAKFDLAFAIRVGALDGRHPELEKLALKRIFKTLKKNGRLLIDYKNGVREINPPH